MPPTAEVELPSEEELRELWARHELSRRERERMAAWRELLEGVRRDRGGALGAVDEGGEVPAYVRDRLAVGPQSREALRPRPAAGRVMATGVDTMSPCWYAEPGSPLAAAMAALATANSRFAALLPEPVGGYRVGWFPESGLVFAEGRPAEEGLAGPEEAIGATEALADQLGALGVSVGDVPSGGLRRLDIAVDLWMDSMLEGLSFLECAAAASLGGGKLCAYRSDRRVESVFIKSRAGKTLARIYDKGVQGGSAPRGRWLRLEAQWRFPRGSRLPLHGLDAALLRERFKLRFEGLWQAAGGFWLGDVAEMSERIAAAVEIGQLHPSRARSLAGYLVLSAAGVEQGAKRTTYELERECRELGLTVSLADNRQRVDVASVVDECLRRELWHG